MQTEEYLSKYSSKLKILRSSCEEIFFFELRIYCAGNSDFSIGDPSNIKYFKRV
jgi:hypothetical protein